jgi:hypothetical protein
VTIHQDRRHVGGAFATVMDYFWREDIPWLVLQLPDGRRVAVPATWTDLPADTFPISPDLPLLCPQALAEMTRLWRHLAQRSRTKPRPQRRPSK